MRVFPRKALFGALLAGAVCLFPACGSDDDDDDDGGTTTTTTGGCDDALTAFSTNLQPAITSSCAGCHGTQAPVMSATASDSDDNRDAILSTLNSKFSGSGADLAAYLSSDEHGGRDISEDFGSTTILTSSITGWVDAEEACE